MPHNSSFMFKNKTFGIIHNVTGPHTGISFSPQEISALADDELIFLLRWFSKYGKEIYAIENFREYGIEEDFLDDVKTILNNTNDKWIRKLASEALNDYQTKLLSLYGPEDETKSKIKDTSGYVYLAYSNDGFYKIGRSKTPITRIKALGVVLPHPLLMLLP